MFDLGKAELPSTHYQCTQCLSVDLGKASSAMKAEVPSSHYQCTQCLSVDLGKAISATRGELPSTHYQCSQRLSVDLRKAIAAAGAALPSPTSLWDVFGFTEIRLPRQEQSYLALPVYVVL